MIALKCPSCGADLEFDDDRETAYCQYCGTRLLLNLCQRVKVDAPVSVIGVAGTDNLLARAKEFESQGNYESAEDYYNRVLDIDINNATARDGLSRVQLALASLELTFVRENAFGGGAMRAKILVDGQVVGKLAEGESQTVILRSGSHSIQIFGGGSSSETVTINVRKPGEKCTLSFKSKFAGWKISFH